MVGVERHVDEGIGSAATLAGESALISVTSAQRRLALSRRSIFGKFFLHGLALK